MQIVLRRPNYSFTTSDTIESTVGDTIERVNLPFRSRPVIERLADDGSGKEQWAVREDTGVVTESPHREDQGWTIEHRAPITAQWADVWITATAYEETRSRTRVYPSYPGDNKPGVVDFPCVNISLQDAMRLAKEMVTHQRKADKNKAARQIVGVIRIRHQHSGSVIMGDLL